MKQYLYSLLFLSFLFADESYEEYQPQKFFTHDDFNTFFKTQTGELLKKIIVDGHNYYMKQDGDLLNEDVATIEDELFLVRGGKFSFGKSKRLLATKVYPTHQEAFYSGCDYIIKEKKLIPLPRTCGFKYRKNRSRSERIEWEHIVPAWHFGHQLGCWQNGGRMKCRQSNAKFKQMEADMHNLVPAIGEINGDRSNFKYGMIEGEERLYGRVNMEIKFSDKKAEPKESKFGDIARIYFYMRDRYGLQISKSQEKMLIAWNNSDPVNQWERTKNQIIKKLQGDENLYITNYHKIEQLGKTKSTKTSDFTTIQEELSQKYSFILDKLSDPISWLLLTIMSLFVLYRRKKSIVEKEVTQTIESKSFLIISRLGEVAISINEKDEIIIEKIDKNNPNQHWIFTKANKRREYFFIENPATGKVIEIEGANSNDGASIILSKKRKRKNDHQEWRWSSAKETEYLFIINKWSLNVLDVKYKKISDGTKLQSYHKKVRGTENQEWKIVLLSVVS